jgi:hypothetical protein
MDRNYSGARTKDADTFVIASMRPDRANERVRRLNMNTRARENT